MIKTYVITRYDHQKTLKETLVVCGLLKSAAHKIREELNEHANAYTSGVRYKCYSASQSQIQELRDNN